MNNFTYIRAASVKDAVQRATADQDAMFIAGGTNLVDRLKVFLDEPSQLIDISRLQMQRIERMPNGGLRLGSLVSNTAVADHADVRRDYPLLSRAILSGASQQIRNMATVGGNLLQRTRCPYYYDTAFPCNKREPGTGCPAATGINRMHAIFGASDQCVAVHPSDMCVALAALDAVVDVEGPKGKRQIPFADFHRLPGNAPQRDTNLEMGELIAAVSLPPVPFAKSGVYLKLRDRTSYAFALVSVAARLGATADGSLTLIDHEVKSSTSPVDVFTEPCTSITPVMYATPNLRLKQELAKMNIGTPTFMRAPGENPGLWALESAMDELAWALKIDPVELRLKNEAKEHQRKGLPFSAKHFADCLRVGAEQFGWQDRPKQLRSLTRDGKFVGWGMAAATFPGLRGAASVKVRLLPDGTAHVLTAGNDMGTGAYTVVAATAAEALGLPVEEVRVELGDSLLPDGGIAGGSMMTASLVPAVMSACQQVLKNAKAKTAQEAFATLSQSGRAAYEATAYPLSKSG
jgi:CO/xanthine dehydrogenase FAD-binding subunit